MSVANISLRDDEKLPYRVQTGSDLDLLDDEARNFRSEYMVSFSDKFETMDFGVKATAISDHDQRTHPVSLELLNTLRWLLVVLTAIFMALCFFVMKIGVMLVVKLKGKLMTKLSMGFPESFWYTYMGLTLFNLVCMAIASGSCLLLSMESTGGNVSGVMAYLNGSRIKKFFTVRLVFVKMLSTSFLMCTSSPGGREGPMIHLGAAIGNLMPALVARIYFSPALNHLCSVYERRDMSVCGIAAGIAAGFGAPFGGLFLALEETTTYYSSDLLPRMIACSFLCKIFCDMLSVLSQTRDQGDNDNSGIYKLIPHLDLVDLNKEVWDVEWLELGMVIVYGVVGAIFGVVFIILSKKNQILRKKFSLGDKKLYLFSETLVNSFIASTFVIIMLRNFSEHCILNDDNAVPSLACPKTPNKRKVPITAIFLISFEEGYKAVMEAKPDEFPFKMLLLFFIFFYLFCILSTSHAHSSGFFMIHFLLGALWGRLLGEGIRSYWGAPTWMDPRKFALIGAGSQITAIARSQVCIVCLCLEAGDVFGSCGVQLFIATIITKFVANYFIPSIYHVQLDLMGVPFLENETPRGTRADVQTIVNPNNNIFSSEIDPLVGHLYNITQEQKGNYPILTPEGVIVGDISRCMIYNLLASNVYDAEQPLPETNYKSLARVMFNVDCTIEYVQNLRRDMILNVTENDKLKHLNLTPFINHNTFYIRQSVSLYFIYNLFRRMGMRTLYIIDINDKLVGLVTRKDVARYRLHLHMGRYRLEKIRVPSSSDSKSVGPSEGSKK